MQQPLKYAALMIMLWGSSAAVSFTAFFLLSLRTVSHRYVYFCPHISFVRVCTLICSFTFGSLSLHSETSLARVPFCFTLLLILPHFRRLGERLPEPTQSTNNTTKCRNFHEEIVISCYYKLFLWANCVYCALGCWQEVGLRLQVLSSCLEAYTSSY